MRVVLHKGQQRNSLSCFHEDGSATRAEIGPGLPAHDLTHLVVESALGMTGGFFGLVRSGRSLQEMSDRAVIPTLGAEAHLSEVLARGSAVFSPERAGPRSWEPCCRWSSVVSTRRSLRG